MMYLLAALLLASAVLAQVVSVNCEKVWGGSVDTTTSVSVKFNFSTLAPYLDGRNPFVLFDKSRDVAVWGYSLYNTSVVYLAEQAYSGRWDRDLKYNVTLEYWNGVWELELHRCTARFNNGRTETRYYYTVKKEPLRKKETITFVVPSDRVRHEEARNFSISIRPDRRGYQPLCIELPSSNTWPSCKLFTKEVTAFISSPGLWKALEINGLKPGAVVRKHGVNATIPNPWHYTDSATNRDFPWDTVSVDSLTVKIAILAMPSWGFVELRPPKPIPLYISRPVRIDNDIWVAKPPESFLIHIRGNATWTGKEWVWKWTLAALAYKSPLRLTPYVAASTDLFSVINRDFVRVYMPLGSIALLDAAVFWRLDLNHTTVWAGSLATYLRVVDNRGVLLADHYEEAGAKGKLAYEKSYWMQNESKLWARFAAAVDKSMQRLYTAWYAPPQPCRQWPVVIYHCVYSVHIYTKVNGSSVGYSRFGPPGRGGPLNSLALVDWPVLRQIHICGETRFFDFMNIVVGDPALEYWHTYYLQGYFFNPQTGDWDVPVVCIFPAPHKASMLGAVYGVLQYKNTTRGSQKLYHQTAEGAFYDYTFRGINNTEYPAGWTDAQPISVSTMTSNSTTWAVQLVPTTACSSLICTEFKPALWGPVPSLTPDVALAGAGYSFLLTYLGAERNLTVRIYVEMGYVVNKTRDGVSYKWVRNYPLVEIKRTWKPFDAVYIGPGWHVGYKPLSACQPLELSVNAVYVTPVNWTGPVQVVVEEGDKRHVFEFFVSNDVSFRISTDTIAPKYFTAPYSNTTVYLFLNGVPYFHGINAFGEGGRQRQYACVPGGNVSQLAVSGDFWGLIELYGRVKVNDVFAKPRFELADPQRGLVKITADGPVYGFVFYLQRNGMWEKVAEVRAPCVLVNMSQIYPWDPVLVYPLVRQEAVVRSGDTVMLWRPQTALLFKTWADLVGYLKGARSVLRLVGVC